MKDDKKSLKGNQFGLFPKVLCFAARIISLPTKRLWNVDFACLDGWFTQKSPKHNPKDARKRDFTQSVLINADISFFISSDIFLRDWIQNWGVFHFDLNICVHFSIPHMWITKFIVLWDDFMDKFVITGWRDWVERWRNLLAAVIWFFKL